MDMQKKRLGLTAVNGVFSAILINKISEVSWVYLGILALVVYGFIGRQVWRCIKSHRIIVDGESLRGTNEQPHDGEGVVRICLRVCLYLWFAVLNFVMVSVALWLCFLKLCEVTTYSVYYENYVLNYGLPMGTGCRTNECVGGWYRFDFVGTHDSLDAAKCLYGENRRYKFGCFDRFRTLRNVIQVNAKDQPLMFAENRDLDGPSPIMEFDYTSQDQLSRVGSAPIRLRVSVKTMDSIKGCATKYVCNYSDRWGKVNTFVSLTKGDSRDRYYLPGLSINERTAYPGRSNVTQYSVVWDKDGREVENRFLNGMDLMGVSRMAYGYRTDKIDDNNDFTYVKDVRCYKIKGDKEVLVSKTEMTWDANVRTDRVFDSSGGFYEHRAMCQSRSLATANRIESYVTDEHFEHKLDALGQERCDVITFEYDSCFNCTKLHVQAVCDSSLISYLDKYAPIYKFSWTDAGMISSVEAQDENGNAMNVIPFYDDFVAKIMYQHKEDKCVVVQSWKNPNEVLRCVQSDLFAPFGYHPSSGKLSFKVSTDESQSGQRVVEIVFDEQGGKNYLKSRYVYYKENREEEKFPEGRLARAEHFSEIGMLSTNAVSSYFTYEQGLLVKIENKRGAARNAGVELDCADFYTDENGAQLPAILRFEYDDTDRLASEWRLDRNGLTNAIPNNMAYVIQYKYNGAARRPCQKILIGRVGVITNVVNACNVQ